MFVKVMTTLGALAVLSVAFGGPADAQRRRDYGDHYGDDRGQYPGRRCLSSDGINASIMRDGWYPEALVAQRDGGRILLMRVSQGPRRFIATVDGCTGQILRMRGAE